MDKKWRILIVDDDATALKMVSALLAEDGYDVHSCHNGLDALEYFKNYGTDVILADMKMPLMGGMELFAHVRELDADVPFIIMTAFGTINSAVEAVKQGVANYVIKPLNYDELTVTLAGVMKQRALSLELEAFRRMEVERNDSVGFVGNHPTIVNIFQMIGTIAPTDAPVLIYGETGTGKELIARAIHMASLRKDKPMICINSAALNDNLLESELFGYVKGAFTNANTTKMGRLELADGGILFLDEISQMSLTLQAKLLRFLQEGTFEPVGSNTTKKVDVRVIAATNQDLHQGIEEKRFLSDLLYRLDVISLKVPPLRERREDIPLLVGHFIAKHSAKYNKKVLGMDAHTLELISQYDWPGNVRQLENYIMRSVIVCKGEYVTLNDLPEHFRETAMVSLVSHENDTGFIQKIPQSGLKLKDMEMELIVKMIEHCNGNKSKAAEMLGISRRALYAKLERFDEEQDGGLY